MGELRRPWEQAVYLTGTFIHSTKERAFYKHTAPATVPPAELAEIDSGLTSRPTSTPGRAG